MITSPFGSGKSDVEEEESEPKRGARSCFQLCFRSEPVSRVSDEETELARSDDQVRCVDLVFSLLVTRYFKAILHDYYFYVSGWANSDLGLILLGPGVRQILCVNMALSL